MVSFLSPHNELCYIFSNFYYYTLYEFFADILDKTEKSMKCKLDSFTSFQKRSIIIIMDNS